jgi:hypothetical protein
MYLVNGIARHVRTGEREISEEQLFLPPAQWSGAPEEEQCLIAATIYYRASSVLASDITPGPFPLHHRCEDHLGLGVC